MMYRWIGWNRKDNHDKVWGVVYLDSNTSASDWTKRKVLIFWGRRGSKLRTRHDSLNYHDLNQLISSKRHGGYVRIPQDNLDTIYPEFATDLDQTVFWEILKT